MRIFATSHINLKLDLWASGNQNNFGRMVLKRLKLKSIIRILYRWVVVIIIMCNHFNVYTFQNGM